MKKETNKKEMSIETVATEFQQLNREAKELDGRMKPLKDALLKYAKEHNELMSEDFKVKFANGTYVLLKVSDVLKGDDKARELLLNTVSHDAECVSVELNDKVILTKAKDDAKLRKTITASGMEVAQKETWAVYGG